MGVRVGSSAAGVMEGIDEHERALFSLIGEAEGFECFPGVVEVEHDISVGRCGVELKSVAADLVDYDGGD